MILLSLIFYLGNDIKILVDVVHFVGGRVVDGLYEGLGFLSVKRQFAHDGQGLRGDIIHPQTLHSLSYLQLRNMRLPIVTAG